MVSEEDLKARLDEAYSVHEKSTKKAEKIIKRQEELSQKWREQQKVALTKLQSLLTESYMKNDENNNKISSLQTSYQSAVVGTYIERMRLSSFTPMYAVLQVLTNEVIFLLLLLLFHLIPVQNVMVYLLC